MQISRQDIVIAAENADLREDDYSIRESYAGRFDVTGAGVVLPASDTTLFMVSLAVLLAEDGRSEDALNLARLAHTDSMGLDGVIVYWGGVELAD